MYGAISTVACSVGKLSRFSFSSLRFNSKRLIHSCSCSHVRFKDTLPDTAVAAGSQDILLQNVRSATDSSEVLNAINRHHSIMNSQHVLQALKSIFSLQKAHSSRMSNGEVVNNKDFRKLCEILKSQVRHLELSELIDVLKCLGYLGIRPDSKIISIILNLISKQVNDLSLQQISFLDFVMKDFKPTPLVKALKIALPIVFEANLNLKCDFENVSEMCDLLSFVARAKNMENSTDKLVDAITEKRGELNLKDAKNVVFALCDARHFTENYNLLLCHALDILTDSLGRMDFYEMDLLLNKLLTRHSESHGDPSFYHEEFCNGCCQMVIDNDYNFEQNLWVLRKIVKFNHCHLGLLAHVAAKVEQEPWQLEHCGAMGFITFLSGLSSADYKPPNWDTIKPLVVKAAQGLMDRTELPWLKLILHLCVLDCWSQELFNKFFSSEFLSSFMKRDYNKLDHIQLLVLDQVSATLAPWAVRPRAPPDLIAPTIQFNGNHVTSFPLQASLSHGLGGNQYVITGALTPLAHFLDHVVVMRKGGYPVAINPSSSEGASRTNMEDIQVPPDSKMIAVILITPSMCAVNNERVRGIFRLRINSIEALGIAVTPVLQTVWNTLPDFERIPYLMRAIREKLPDSEMTSVVTPA